jgi:hypothetical protein
MSEARALLEAIKSDIGRCTDCWSADAEFCGAHTASGAAIRRADRPEARVAEGLDYRALYDGRVREWLAVTAYLGTEADSAGELIAAIDARCRADRPEARVAEGLCAFGACGAERVSWQHLPCSRSEPDPCPEPCPAMDSGCHPFLPAPRPPEPDHDRPEARVAEGLLAEMVGDYHQTGSIRDHVDPGAAGWDVNKDWRICEDSLCVATRDVLANLPAPRPPEPDRPEARVAVEGDTLGGWMLYASDLSNALLAMGHHATARHQSPNEYDAESGLACSIRECLAETVEALDFAGPTFPLPAPRPPEPESRTEAVRRMQREGGGPVTAVMVSRADEAPRPPEPDRTAALVEKAMQDDMRRHPEAYGLDDTP